MLWDMETELATVILYGLRKPHWRAGLLPVCRGVRVAVARLMEGRSEICGVSSR
ncbi:hypothetical protein GCM10011402_14680 [Paracoccus acridae]|uniref:Uncharacterized protein n=1 Tax=Paracoccus acridae TaxID=1795310 RepID=A0ABQ1VHZ2_9RHOB|nr:hypothetical protein GCM10011402_14680 [Paracoccus acridae]